MSQYEKVLPSILSGTRDRNILFTDLQAVLNRLGFQCHIKGDHFIYTKDGVEEIINIQPIGSKALSGEAGTKHYPSVSVGRRHRCINMRSFYIGARKTAHISQRLPRLAGCMADSPTAWGNSEQRRTDYPRVD